MTRILFLCSRNACRSQMAEGFARTRKLDGVEVWSAGTEASQVHPMAVKVMAEVGLDISRQKSKALSDLPPGEFHVVIALCSQAAGQCPLLPGHPVAIHWDLPDPDAMKGDPQTVLTAFRQARDTIRGLVNDFFDRGYFAALRDTKRCETLILNGIADGILAHDLHRRIFYFNASAERITGYTRDEVLGRDCHEVFPGNLCGGKCLFSGDSIPEFDQLKREIEITTKKGESRLVETVVSAMKENGSRLEGVLVAFRDLTNERRLARRVGEIERFSGIIGRDQKMLAIYDLIRDLAHTSVPVLIQGDSGTGKELVAAAIHNEGDRAGKLFVPVNCGALPETLLESELFGHVKGAFTGAVREKKGRFHLADGGTIFLDEIGDVSPAMQVKLMRVLQEGTFEPVGSEQTVKVDVRIISATNKNLADEIAAGRFRDDLYYRLSVVPIFMPTLSERRTDIPLLVENALQRALTEMGRHDVTVSPETMDVLLAYDWPGNVRELQNWIQFALIKCRGSVMLPEHLPPAHYRVGRSPHREPLKRGGGRKLDEERVRAALDQAKGNKVEAARLLGVSRATLYRFLDEPAK